MYSWSWAIYFSLWGLSFLFRAWWKINCPRNVLMELGNLFFLAGSFFSFPCLVENKLSTKCTHGVGQFIFPCGVFLFFFLSSHVVNLHCPRNVLMELGRFIFPFFLSFSFFSRSDLTAERDFLSLERSGFSFFLSFFFFFLT